MRRSAPSKMSVPRRTAKESHHVLRLEKVTPPPPTDSSNPSTPGSNAAADEGEPPAFMARLEEEDFFHGLLLRDDGARMCKQEGDFVVLTAKITPRLTSDLMLLLRQKSEVRDIPIKMDGTKLCFNSVDGAQFDTVAQLIRHYWKRNLPVFSDVYLKRPVPRSDWELPHAKIELKQKLGEGAQAEVQAGLFHGSSKKPPIEVAVKIYKGTVTQEKLVEIMHEVRINLQFDHENVVKLVGIAACRAPMLIVLEMVHGGGLNRYLKIKRNEVTTRQRVCMCVDAAAGLAYIHSLGIVHRDIASRNCLYSQSKQRVLISDFGLSQQEEIVSIDPSKPMPIRWLAPEVMRTFQCTKPTDVWSYGVLCWEVHNNCKDPYSEIPLQKDVMDKVLEGTRLKFNPPNVPQPMIDIVNRCWDVEPANRPTMAEIVSVMMPLCERDSKPIKKQPPGKSKRSVRETSNKTRKMHTINTCEGAIDKQLRRQRRNNDARPKARK